MLTVCNALLGNLTDVNGSGQINLADKTACGGNSLGRTYADRDSVTVPSSCFLCGVVEQRQEQQRLSDIQAFVYPYRAIRLLHRCERDLREGEVNTRYFSCDSER